MKIKKFHMKSVLKNATFLNLMLIILILVLANYIILPMLNVHITYKFTSREEKSGKDISSGTTLTELQFPSPSDFIIVGEDNLFHPERKIPVEKKVEEKTTPKPEFVLYGTVITDAVSIAYLEDFKEPHNTPGRGRRQIALREGDYLSGFTLKEIETDRIVMVRGEEKLIIDMYDSHKKKVGGTSSASAIPKSASAQSTQSIPPKERQIKSRKKIDHDVINFLRNRQVR